MKKVAVMLDGRFVIHKLGKRLKADPTAEQIYEFALACVAKDEEELLRIYYYDCPPMPTLRSIPYPAQK